MTAFTFDARSVEPDQGRVGALPKGWYKTMVTKTELKATGNGTGQAISVQFGVVDGPHKGAVFFNNFNVVNASEKAVEIGHKQLSALCYAVNVLQMSDTDQLKNIAFYTRLKLTPAEMDPQDPTKVKYEEKNEPTAYRNINDQSAIEAFTKQNAAPAAAAPTLAPPPMAPAQQWQAPPQQQAPHPAYQPQQGAPVSQAPAYNPNPAPAPQPQYDPAQQQQQAPAQSAPPQWAAPAAAQPWDANAQQQPVQAPHQAPPQQYAPPPQQQAPAAPPPWIPPQQ